MALFYLLIFAILLVGIRFRHKYLHGDYMDVPHANAVKGFFILLVFASHIQGFLLRNGYAYTSLDRFFVGANAWLGQLTVSMFLFYSGYGVMESIRKKGSSYVDDLPKRRIAVVLLDFDIAVLVYVLFNLLFSHFPGWKTVLLSLICWESVGNSNWDTHQHHFEERALFVGCGVRAVGTNESNTYRRTRRKNTVFRGGNQYSRTQPITCRKWRFLNCRGAVERLEN